MAYLYETHLHTCLGSACGVSRGYEYIQVYKDLGFQGIIVTDHFYRGNCAVSRSLPWSRWVAEYCRGYEEARNEGERRGLDVFFGWEETFDGDDYLVYGLDRDWLLEHPECRFWTRKQQFEAVDQAGGCVVQAHPFRQHYYISRIILSPWFVHGIEAANGGNSEDSYDVLALAYARRRNLPVTAGTDIHEAHGAVPGAVFGVYLPEKIGSIAGYVQAVRTGTIAGLLVREGRWDLRGREKVRLPIEIRDREDRSSPISLGHLLGKGPERGVKYKYKERI
jgi:hypothetical protein